MLISAETAVISATLTHNLTFGLLIAILTGGLVGALHAVLCIKYKVNHIIAALRSTCWVTGISTFFSQKYLEQNINLLNNCGYFSIRSRFPSSLNILFLAPQYFENNIIIYLMLLLVIGMQIMLFFTPGVCVHGQLANIHALPIPWASMFILCVMSTRSSVP